MALSGGLVERFCGALGSVRGQIDTASPTAITQYGKALAARAAELTKLLGQLRAGHEDVARSWKEGPGRDATLRRMEAVLKHLATTISTLDRLVPQLTQAASTIAKGQQGFATGVQTGSARIAQILATGNPGAKAAAAASAAATTSTLQQLISAFGTALEALGVKGIGPLLNAVGQVAGQLSGQGAAGSALSPALTSSMTSAGQLPLTQQLPAQQLPAFTQYPWSSQPVQQPVSEANSWIPVSQPVAAGAGQVEVTVTTKAGDTTTVRAASGQDASFDLEVGAEDVHIAIDGDGDGRVAGRTI
jgi:hypothetical protein